MPRSTTPGLLNFAVARIKDEKARMYRMLRKLNMVRPMPSWANFVLVRVERGDPSLYPDELLKREIRIHVPEQPELAGYFRISAVSHDATAALRAALSKSARLSSCRGIRRSEYMGGNFA